MQTEGHITSKHVTLEVSPDQVSNMADVANWYDISGSSNAVSVGGGEHMTGSTHTFEGHAPLTGIGGKNPITLGLRLIYTEEAEESVDLLKGYCDNQTKIWLRYRPKGAEAGAWQFVGRGHIVGPVIPSTDKTSADIVTVETDWFGAELTLGQQAT